MTRKLDVAKVMLGAFAVPWWRWREYFQALAIPLLLAGGLMQVWRDTWERVPAWANWIFWLIYSLGFAWCVVTCHRLALADDRRHRSGFLPKWSSRETRFYLWMMAILLISRALELSLSMLCFAILPSFIRGNEELWVWWIQLAVKIPGAYLFARLSFIFPAMAIDRKVTLRWIWLQTKGNGWRLAFVIAFLPWLFSLAVNYLHREQATASEVLMLIALGCVLLVIEVTALSLSYRELCDRNDMRRP